MDIIIPPNDMLAFLVHLCIAKPLEYLVPVVRFSVIDIIPPNNISTRVRFPVNNFYQIACVSKH